MSLPEPKHTGPWWRRAFTALTAVLLLTGIPLVLLAGTAAPAFAGTDDYPAAWKNAPQDSVFDSWGNYNRECTSFVGFRLSQHGYTQPWRGQDATQWGSLAKARNIRVDNVPAVGSVAWKSSGHVAWVEAVNSSNGTVLIEDYNSNWNGMYRGNVWLPISQYTGFIHFHDLSSAPSPSGGGGMRGSLDLARRVPGGIAVGGWSIDNDTPNSIATHVYGGDGNPKPGVNPGVPLTANQARPDVAKAFPAYGPNHGFSGLLSTDKAGTQTVCAYGINAPGTPGGNDKLACKSVTISNLPFGSLDAVNPVAGGVNAYGWAIDPDTDSPIAVHLYAGDGLPRPGVNPGIPVTADGPRPDVANAFPGYSANHGYGTFFALPPGPQTVCAYGINADGTPGSNPQLGCKSITVA